MSKIIIGSVQGKAVGGGVGLASAVDICFATEFADIKLSELSVGIGPFVIEPAVKRKIGVSAMSQLALKAQTFFQLNGQWKRLYANVFESNNRVNPRSKSLALELSRIILILLLLQKNSMEGTDDWDKLLESRAQLSGKMSLSPKAKSYLKNLFELSKMTNKIKIDKTHESRLNQLDFDNIPLVQPLPIICLFVVSEMVNGKNQKLCL